MQEIFALIGNLLVLFGDLNACFFAVLSTFLFAMDETPGAYIKGTYVNADLLSFLEEQLAEEGT